MPQRCAPIFAVILLSWAGCTPESLSSALDASPADDAARCQELTRRLGQPLRVYPSEQFLLLSAGDAETAARTGQLLDQVSRRFHDGFAQAGFPVCRPAGKLVWVCLGSYEALEAYGRQADGVEVSWMDAFYSLRTNRVAVVRGGPGAAAAKGATVVQPGGTVAFGSPGATSRPAGEGLNLQTATHELAHQLAFNGGLQRRGLTYAFWLTEGLATNFEAETADGVGLGRDAPLYHARLAEAKAAGRLLPLEEFVAMTQLPPGSPAQATREAYAQAWGLFHFLFDCRPDQLRSYLSASAEAPPGEPGEKELRRRFVSCFGEIGALEEEFGRFIADGAAAK
ncbi:MAG: DUF1570 domain-containing protein [Planctomycetota bacterium]|nr:DUF1570 domain-containing protein [Planctomycetota bacterium]